MIINKSGLTIRMAVEDLRVMGRATQGVKLINLKGKDSIAAVTKVMKDDPEEVIVDEDGNIVEVEAIERVKPVLEVLEDEGLKMTKMTIQMMKRLMMNQTKTMLMMKHR
jgi:DNA gyrase subunit A